VLQTASSLALGAAVTDAPELRVGQVLIVELRYSEEDHRDDARSRRPAKNDDKKRKYKKGLNAFKNSLEFPMQNCLLAFYYFLI
jgi:hypothetical protein